MSAQWYTIPSKTENARMITPLGSLPVVEPANPEALAEAMVEVVNQPPAERAIRLAEARKIVEREYDDTVIKQRLWALYAELSPRP